MQADILDRVLAVGADVTDFQPGDIVVTNANGAPDKYGYPNTIWAYDTPTGLALPPPAAAGLLVPGGLAFDTTGNTLYFVADIPNGPDTDAALRKLELPGGAVEVGPHQNDAARNRGQK